LDTGMQIEGFACPAGLDGLGVAMVEAIHLKQAITLGLLLPSPQRKVNIAGPNSGH
jgi:hypothetical protein